MGQHGHEQCQLVLATMLHSGTKMLVKEDVARPLNRPHKAQSGQKRKLCELMEKRHFAPLADFVIIACIVVLGFLQYAGTYKNDEGKFVFYQKYFFSAANLFCLNDPDIRAYNSDDRISSERIDPLKFSCAELAVSPKVPQSYYNGWHDTHPVLSTLIGRAWDVLGFSWTSLWPIAGGLGALTLLALYATLRAFGVPWFASVLLFPATVQAHVLLSNFYFLRDFSKVPFILLAFATTGILFHKEERRGFRFAAIVVGTSVAVLGMGFRQDTLVVVPIILAAIVISSRFDQPGCWRKCSVELILVVATFVAVDSLVDLLKTSQEARLEGYPHFILQGFADPFLHDAGVSLPGISFMPLYSDTLAHAFVDANDYRQVRYFAGFDPLYTTSGFRLIGTFATLSAGQMVLRALQGFSTVSHSFWLLQSPGLWLLALLGMVALGKWRLGLFLATTIAVLAVAGSLQFSARHIVHLIVLDRVLLVIIGGTLVSGLWAIVYTEQAVNWRLMASVCIAGATLLLTVTVIAYYIQGFAIRRLASQLSESNWYPSFAEYKQAYPSLPESYLRVTLAPEQCAGRPIAAKIELEGQTVTYPIESDLTTRRSLYFAILDPSRAETRVEVFPKDCVVSMEWGPLGDGAVPPLQFFDPMAADRSRSLVNSIGRVLAAF